MIVFIGTKEKLDCLLPNETADIFEIKDIEAVATKLRLAQHYDKIIVDIDFIENKNDLIIQSLYSINKLCAGKLIVLAQGHTAGDRLLGGLVANEIYNIINDTDIITIQSELTAFLKDKENSFEDIAYLAVEPEKHNRPSFKTMAAIKNIVKNTAKPIEKTNIRRQKTIGIIGTQKRIGTTTQAFQLIQYLKFKGAKACYIEYNGNGFVDIMAQIYDNVKKISDDIYQFSEIDIYKNPIAAKTSGNNYDYLVYDFGASVNNSEARLSWLERDIQIAVCGTKCDEIKHTINLLADTLEIKSCNYIMSFVPEAEKNSIKSLMEEKKDKTHFSYYQPDMFEKIKNLEQAELLYKAIVNE